MKIIQSNFNKDSATDISHEWYGKNWPVVYILNNNKEAYIGETTSITNRMKQHLDNPDRQMLTQTNVIIDDRFNKSAILDIESKLIEYMSADQRYKLQNSNSGMRNHDYYDKSMYEAIFRHVWDELRKKKIAHHDIDVLYNSQLFKYSPYKSLTEEQFTVARDIVRDIIEAVLHNKPSTTLINGEAGTGKTVMAMYLMKLFADNRALSFMDDEDIYEQKYESIREKLQNFKIGLVVPMTSLRGTLRKVASGIEGLHPSMILGPNDVVKAHYDLLLVDESHRLYRRTGITSYGSYDTVNKKLELEAKSTQLDWILKQSNHSIFFYDETQSVRPSDVRKEDFFKLRQYETFSSYKLESQLRVLGGEDYISYIGSLLFGQQKTIKRFENYEFKLFDSITELKDTIYEKEHEFGLSRLVAGFAWPWSTKKLTYEEAIKTGVYDIEIENEKFIWNTIKSGWVISDNALNEVGSIHTIQGYDLNYVGVIIGTDIIYNEENHRIEVVKANYYDTKGKVSLVDEEELRTYVLNIYKVLLTRGIRGTFVYVCDPALRAYLREFIVSD